LSHLYKLGSANQIGRKRSPDSQERPLIQRYMLDPVPPEQIRVYDFDACNTAMDRDTERFLPECLVDFAATAPGKPLLAAHDWSAPSGIGRIFRAWVESRGAVDWLRVSVYMVLNDPDSAAFARKLDTGLAAHCSVGFYCPSRMAVSESGQQVGVYSRGPNGEPCELLELSLVWLGSQIQAGPTKHVLAAMTKGLRGRYAEPVDWSWLIPKEILIRRGW
jgi:hypothetical protein